MVVGAGAMGSATAWTLARRGIDVALIEQFEPGHVRGSSHGGSRIFRLAYTEPSYVRLAIEALDRWRELEDDAGEPLLTLTGGVDHGDPADIDAIATALAGAGRERERLTPDEAHERWPALRFDRDAVYSPDTGRVRADAAVAALQRRAAELGAAVAFGEPVVAVDPAAKTVRTAQREWHARRAIVVTAGAWLTKVVAGLHVNLPPLRVTREQVFHFAPRHDDASATATEWPSFIHYTSETPSHYGLLTPGEGVKVAEHGTGPETDPDERSFAIDEAGRERIVDYVREWLPGLDADAGPVTETTCLYTNTPDGAFVLDRRGDLVIGSPCSGHGFKFTPAIGRILADLATKD